jgi:hypothetical protein
MLTSTFNYMCTNYNKKSDSADMQDRYRQFKERFGREDNDVFDRAVRMACDEEKYFPNIATIIRFLAQCRPANTARTFDYCNKCKGKGRVALILGVKKRKNESGEYTGKKTIIHREIWTIERWHGFYDDPANEKLANDPDVYLADISAFCRCTQGRSMYQDNGGGLKLSEMEYARISTIQQNQTAT